MAIAAVFLSFSAQGVPLGPSRFWCNERFLQPEQRAFDARHLMVAKRGYLYAMAAALALQRDNAEGRAYHFAMPARMKQIDQEKRDRSGFEASAFEIRDATGETMQEVVVAFTGSNDDADWRDTNFGSDTRQYALARRYVSEIAERAEYDGVRLVVAGFSLGGALAVHVTKHAETSHFVAETWAFNPSPKTWVHGRVDQRIWLAAVNNEALRYARTDPFTVLPGVEHIGAPPSQTAEGFYLLEANPVISHYRWVLTRNILHVADLAFRIDDRSDAPTEPSEILRASSFRSCRNERPPAPLPTARRDPAPHHTNKG